MSPQPLKTSEPIPGYTMRERIGAGGYGEVWKVDAPGGLTKAIKFVYGYLDDARASGELKALNRIKEVRHPFLLSLERIEIVEGQLVIVTELADLSLKDRFGQCKESGLPGIPSDELFEHLRDAADALDYLSEKFSLQHLDVKPENLLLLGGRIKVADFGLVKNLLDVNASFVGGLTPLYASPESFDGRPSRHSDQYSLAILYQEMLTGVLPFQGSTAMQLAAQHVHHDPNLDALPPSDRPTIARALSKDPEQRFPNCRAMVDSLLASRAPKAGTAPHEAPVPASKSDAVTGTDTSSPDALDPPKDAQSPPVKTLVFGKELPHVSVRPIAEGAGLAMPRVESKSEVTDLPPVEITPAERGLRPTLFVGIGGTAARTFRQLRQRLHDRLGNATNVPALRMLLLDTDLKTLHQTTQGERTTTLDAH